MAERESSTSGSGKNLKRFKSWLRGASQKAKWLSQKSTMVALSENMEACNEAVEEAINLLQLKLGVRTVEELRSIVKSVTDNATALEAVMETLGSKITQALSQQTRMLTDTIAEKEVDKLLDKLCDPDFRKRQQNITDSRDETYDFFSDGAQEYSQAAKLLKFLKTGTGPFWISGSRK